MVERVFGAKLLRAIDFSKRTGNKSKEKNNPGGHLRLKNPRKKKKKKKTAREPAK